jgi:hypothetical protein
LKLVLALIYYATGVVVFSPVVVTGQIALMHIAEVITAVSLTVQTADKTS